MPAELTRMFRIENLVLPPQLVQVILFPLNHD
jgi:hypothetical protein